MLDHLLRLLKERSAAKTAMSKPAIADRRQDTDVH
jgi:hypothetical protein